MKIIYDTQNRPTLVNDIHDKFTPQSDFMMALNQMDLLGLKQKLTIKVKRNSLKSHLVDEEIWELNL